MEVVEVRRCLICGEVFAINAKQKNKIYCCDCKPVAEYVRHTDYVKANYEKIKECARKYYKKRTHTYICQICGEEKTTSSQGNTKYCLDCLKNSNDWRMSVYYNNRRIGV